MFPATGLLPAIQDNLLAEVGYPLLAEECAVAIVLERVLDVGKSIEWR